MTYSLDNAIEDACKNLHEGWEILLVMEKGSAFVILHNQNTPQIISIDGADMTLAEQVAEAIARAPHD